MTEAKPHSRIVPHLRLEGSGATVYNGVLMARLKATFYLPIKGNLGEDLQGEIAHVEDLCFEKFCGWTMSGYFKGTWRLATGEKSLDTSAVYQVILEESDVPDLEEILRRFKVQTSQEAIYLELDRNIEVRFL